MPTVRIDEKQRYLSRFFPWRRANTPLGGTTLAASTSIPLRSDERAPHNATAAARDLPRTGMSTVLRRTLGC